MADHTPEYMPEFKNEKEFDAYFKQQREICNKHRDRTTGVMSFADDAEFESFLHELFDSDGITFGVIE